MTEQPSRHEKMVATCIVLAGLGAKIGWARVANGKDVKRQWKSDMTDDPALIPTKLAGHNGLVIAAGRLVIIDVDEPGAYEDLQAHGLPDTYRVISPTRNVDPATGEITYRRHVYLLAPEGFDVTTLPGTFAGGEIRRSVNGEQSMVLAPYALRADGIYEPEEGAPRKVAEATPEVLDHLIAAKAPKPPAGVNGTDGDWVWDDAYGSRHDHVRDRVRFWVGKGIRGEPLRQTAREYIERHQIPQTPRENGEPALNDKEIERLIAGAEAKFKDDPPEPRIIFNRPEASPATLRLIDVGTSEAEPSPSRLTDWLIAGAIRPRGLYVLASPEGLGKSVVRCEVALRGAIGTGALFGYPPFAVQRRFRTLLVDEENGEDEEGTREDDALAALGATRASVAGWYVRTSFAGADLVTEQGRAVILQAIALFPPDLLILDTATGMAGEEWGPTLKAALRWLRVVATEAGIAILLVVHVVKPPRNQQGNRVTGNRGVADVMGQWTRPVDGVLLLDEAAGEDRAHFRVFKRLPKADLVIARAGGIWEVVASGTAPTFHIPGLSATQQRVLVAIADGLDPLDRKVSGVGRSQVFDAIRVLRNEGLVGTVSGVHRLTEAGLEAVRVESGSSPGDEEGLGL